MQGKRCHYCGRLFVPDPRVGDRQKACSKGCQRLRKKGNNMAFSRNNPGYWQGRYGYVKEWRQGNPDYQRQWRQKRGIGSHTEIQAEIFRKALDCIEEKLLLLREIQAEIILKPIDITAQNLSSPLQAP